MIYLDHAANTPVFPEVLNAMLPWLQPSQVGNPGSIHTQGVKARKAIDEARQQVAKMLNAHPSEIFFTSGGTESNNAWLKCFSGDLVLTTELEHDSVLEPLANSPWIATQFVRVNSDGSVDLHSLEYSLQHTRNTGRAVSIMWVNNELGTVNDMKRIGELCRQYHSFLHTDAVQAAGHVPIDVKECNIDALSISGHKLGAPLGVGVLYLNSSVHKNPLIAGGGQERGVRGGTENVPGIVGMGKAAEIVTERSLTWQMEWAELRDRFITRVSSLLSDKTRVNGPKSNYFSNIISLTIPGVNSEALLLMLDQRGICLSAGSACSAASSKPSHVLKGIGMSDEDAACTVRISMGYSTTEKEMSDTAYAIAECATQLLGMYP